MSINSYLTNLANSAVLRDSEKASIQRSIATLQSRINTHFSDNSLVASQIARHFIFGSHTRGTILPRSFDRQSDVDYMIVFNDASATPQTYLNRLKRFVDAYYSSSEIKQSNPTIVLNLHHIKFELVPAIEKIFFGLHIPARAASSDDWISTNPNDFNQSLTQKNQEYNNLVKPVARLAKYWNAKNGYPFASFELEQKVVEYNYDGFDVFGLFRSSETLWSYFYSLMASLDVGWFDPQWKKDTITRLKNTLAAIRNAENASDQILAEINMRHLLPEI